MAADLYERYKNALRTGHVAVLRGNLTDAIASYREAAAIAPERALPHSSLGGVLLRLGHVDEALFEYDAALVRAPHDEAVLVGRAEALIAAGRGPDAAASLDGVAEIQEASGRIPEAADTVRRAIDLDPTPSRRGRQQVLLGRLQPTPADSATDEGLGRTLLPLETGKPSDQAAEVAETVESGEGQRAVEADTIDTIAIEPGPHDAAPEREAAVARSSLVALERDAEAAIESGDAEAARTRLLELARARGEAGLLDAALDAAHVALAFGPDDARLHLALVDLYVVRGWRDIAAEKLALLGRLAALSGDEATGIEVSRVAAAAFPSDPRLAGADGGYAGA